MKKNHRLAILFRSFIIKTSVLIKRFKISIKVFIALSILSLIMLVMSNIVITEKSKKYLFNTINEVPKCYTVIVLGAKVSAKGIPSDYLQDRLDTAIELYRKNKVMRFLLSGDHGQKSYDEVNGMKSYLINKGIDTADIFLDHAGFDTYNTMVRAHKIFQVKDAVIVSQEFHLPRAVFIARSEDIDAYGIKADKREYGGMKSLKIREILAKAKAFTEVIINKRPKFLGHPIPITGDSNLSYD